MKITAFLSIFLTYFPINAFAKDELPDLQVVTRDEDGSVQLSSELPPVGAEAQALALAQMIETVGEDDLKLLQDVGGTTNIELK